MPLQVQVRAELICKVSLNARDRIGSGPQLNAKSVKVADSIDNLYSDDNALSKKNSLSEAGDVINGRGDSPNRHDILTGSGLDGNLSGNSCGDWTSSGEGLPWSDIMTAQVEEQIQNRGIQPIPLKDADLKLCKVLVVMLMVFSTVFLLTKEVP